MIEFGVGAQQPIAKKADLWSDRKLANRKRAQAALSVGTSTGALAATGMLGVGAGMKLASRGKVKLPGGRTVVNAMPKAKRKQLKVVGTKLSNAAAPVSIATGGVGALGGYNFAGIQRQEARKRQLRPEVKKAFDSERSRQRRMHAYERTSQAAGVAGLGAAGVVGYRAYKRDPQLKQSRKLLTDAGRSLRQAKKGPLGATAGLAGLGIAGLVGADRLRAYQQSRGSSYRPRWRGWDE